MTDAPTNFDLVKEWCNRFGNTVNDFPALPSVEETNQYLAGLEEELSELRVAALDDDFVEVADALCDLVYFALGMAAAWGIPFDQVFREVHRSNMTKTKYRKPNGKIIKGIGYSEPNLAPIIFGLPNE